MKMSGRHDIEIVAIDLEQEFMALIVAKSCSPYESLSASKDIK